MTVSGERYDMRWFAGQAPRAAASFRLFCFPYAGLGASVYRSWVGAFGPALDVCPIQLPGRESRQQDPPFTRMSPLVDGIVDAIAPYCDVPFALLGHSLGALIAFEVARRVEDPMPLQHLFVSARRAPHLPERFSSLYRLPQDELVAAVQARYDGIPRAVLECADVMALLLPRLRADFEVLETWSYRASSPLECPISVFGGQSDSTVQLSELEGWREHTSGAFQVRIIAGTHLFLQSAAEQMRAAVATDLAAGVARGLP